MMKILLLAFLMFVLTTSYAMAIDLFSGISLHYSIRGMLSTLKMMTPAEIVILIVIGLMLLAPPLLSRYLNKSES